MARNDKQKKLSMNGIEKAVATKPQRKKAKSGFAESLAITVRFRIKFMIHTPIGFGARNFSEGARPSERSGRLMWACGVVR